MAATGQSPVRVAGVMTGTSLDAIDVAIIRIAQEVTLGHVKEAISLEAFSSRPLDVALADGFADLQSSGDDELHRSQLICNAYADAISRAVLETLTRHDIRPSDICAIGVHGQTVRHRPELGYTIQLNAPARIAEATGIAVVSDFRSRDIAAGGQGAPLVPAFHRRLFAQDDKALAVVNIGGIANVSWLGRAVSGFDTGPGNVLMDLWHREHRQGRFDSDGQWAQGGTVHEGLLKHFLAEPFFARPAPKSTGRDLFRREWLHGHLKKAAVEHLSAQDVQATLCMLTATTIANAIAALDQTEPCLEVLVCGGGVRNTRLMSVLQQELDRQCGRAMRVASTETAGWDPQSIEACAFAWLAHQTIHARPGSLSEVTGAIGPRVLGSITPA